MGRFGMVCGSKTEEALVKAELPGDGESMRKLLDENDTEHVRREFAVVLERSLGITLEGKEG